MVELERRVVKSPPEVWEELSSTTRLSRWLGGVRVRTVDPPRRLEWDVPGARGVIKLESLGWGTRVRVQAQTNRVPAWERLQTRYRLERSLRELLDDLSKNSLKGGGIPKPPAPWRNDEPSRSSSTPGEGRTSRRRG
jgi:hypothetical protein